METGKHVSLTKLTIFLTLQGYFAVLLKVTTSFGSAPSKNIYIHINAFFCIWLLISTELFADSFKANSAEGSEDIWPCWTDYLSYNPH